MKSAKDIDGFTYWVEHWPGYNYLHETGPTARGQHGMDIQFTLAGPLGAVHWRMGTSWTPLGVVDEDAPGMEPVHINKDNWRMFPTPFGDHVYGLIDAPSGQHVGWHTLKPRYSGQTAEENCPYLGDRCYTDLDYAISDEVLESFIVGGEDAVWKALHGFYVQIGGEDW